jgi:hypothetical protein
MSNVRMQRRVFRAGAHFVPLVFNTITREKLSPILEFTNRNLVARKRDGSCPFAQHYISRRAEPRGATKRFAGLSGAVNLITNGGV